MSQSDTSAIFPDQVRAGDALELTPGVFWEVVEVEADRPDRVTIHLVHDRAYDYAPSDLVRVKR